MITSFIGQNSMPITRALELRHNRLCPEGAVSPFAGSVAPDGWLMCDGQEVLITTYNKLYTRIGATYGAASDGYFKLPDLRSKFPLGAGDGVGVDLSNRVLAATGGEENHTLTVDEMPAHTHSYIAQSGTQNINQYAAVVDGSVSAADEPTAGTTSGSTGGGLPHNNMPPFIVLNYIIKH